MPPDPIRLFSKWYSAAARAKLPQYDGMALATASSSGKPDVRFVLLKSVDEGLQQRGSARPDGIRAWGTNLVWKFFTALDGYHSWTATAYEPNPTAVPWDLESRNSTDGRKRVAKRSRAAPSSLHDCGARRTSPPPAPSTASANTSARCGAR